MATNTSHAVTVLYSTNVNNDAALGNASYAAGNDVVCYAPTMITTSGFWAGVNPLEYALPLFILQLLLIVLVTRGLVILLRPFHQPRVIAEIIAGIVLGPSLLGRTQQFAETVFPLRSILTLETVAHLGLLLFLFLVGVEMDASVMLHMGRRPLVIAVAGMSLPFLIGTVSSFVFRREISHNVHQVPFLLFLGVTLSVTAFPVLARILAETKLLSTEIGRTAMSAAVVNDIFAWILLALAMAIADSRATALTSLWVLLSAAGFVLFCFFLVRPVMRWAGRRAAEAGEGVTDFQLCALLVGVMLSALATDAIGVHAVFGAFVFGLAVPAGAMGAAVAEKLEDFVIGILLPLFFAISGLRTKLGSINDVSLAGTLVLVFLLASFTKIAGTVLIALYYTMPFRDGLALGFLMNTRGLVEVIILNIGRDKEVLDDESFAVMMLVSLAMTATVTPMVTAIHRPSRRLIGYKRRNLQLSKPEAELRMLACFHSPRQVSPIMSILALSHPTKRSPIFLYALHLIELTGRASNLLAATSTCTTPTNRHSSSAAAAHPFLSFSDVTPPGISVHPLAAASPFATMHEDVCRIAEEKHAALILLPFHKHITVDGDLEPDANPGHRVLNINVLAHAPCSVAILVDRGLPAAASRQSQRVALLFFGGPHDREALSFAWRMADHPLTSLTLLRFLPIPDPRVLTVLTDAVGSMAGVEEEERTADEECLSEFRRKYAGNERVVYTERAVANGEDMVAALRGIESAFDLYVLGKCQGGATSELTAGMTEWAECPELGPIGDLLASSDFAATVSVLVLQQYVGGPLGQAAGLPESPAWAPTRKSNFEIGWGGR